MASLIDIALLLEHINTIDKISDEEWKSTLNDRKVKELEFHDRDRDQKRVEQTQSSDTYEKFYGNKKYYAATKRSSEFVKDWIKKESAGKVFLDYACGNGVQAIYAASCGAAMSLGFDISGVSVQNARNAAAEAGVSENTRFFQADAENTKLPDNSIDAIICSGMLHHLDLSFALPELRRILKPGGKILAVEALDYNPAIKLYHMLTPAMRTDWEKAHILNLNDVKFATRFLELIDIRYWHVLGYLGGKFPYFLPFFNNLDRILEKVPLIQRLSWMFTFVLRKKSEE
ncbi:MAG: class I SAM-dependent methyltransferase [Proteobacteria bacterium]|nr:class I SAM-dependent methyltransferase [Pseudomonadota bacterium]